MEDDCSGGLYALYARGRAAWPDVSLDAETFVATACGLGEGPFDDVRAGDLYLAIACAAGSEQAIAALDRQYLSDLAVSLTRRGHDAATAADVVQAVRIRFLIGDAHRGPRIADYNGRSSLATWLRVSAARTALNAVRKHRRETTLGSAPVAAAACSPELEVLRHRFGAKFQAAFRLAFEALPPRERALLRYQMIDGLGIDRVAALHGVHRATAARWIAHARDAIIEGVRHALQDQLRITPAELDSLLRVLHGNVELSLRLFLTPSDAARARPADAARSRHS